MSSRRGRTEGSVYKRSDGLWVGAVSVGGGKRKTVYAHTRQEVAAKLGKVQEAHRKGLPIGSERTTVRTYMEKWIDGARSTVRASTWRRYEELVRLHILPRLGRIALAKLTPADVSAALAAMLDAGKAPRTVRNARVVFGRALREAEETGVIARNVVRLTRAPRAAHDEMRTLTGAQVRQLVLAAKDDRLRALWVLAFASGARQGELLGAKWDDIAFEAGTFRIVRTLGRDRDGRLAFEEPKTASSRRTVPIGPFALEALRTHRRLQAAERLAAGVGVWQDRGLIFASPLGEPLDGREVTRSFRRLLARAGLPAIRFHDARHSAATLLLEAGTNPKVVAERLGHSTPAITLAVYSHVSPTMQREAAAALDGVLSA